MKTVDALKTLYAALGGDLDDVAELDLIPEVIYAIATLVEAQPKLPEVEDTDEGKVLTVSAAGEWEAADLPE